MSEHTEIRLLSGTSIRLMPLDGEKCSELLGQGAADLAPLVAPYIRRDNEGRATLAPEFFEGSSMAGAFEQYMKAVLRRATGSGRDAEAVEHLGFLDLLISFHAAKALSPDLPTLADLGNAVGLHLAPVQGAA
jgi:hypothetical protein